MSAATSKPTAERVAAYIKQAGRTSTGVTPRQRRRINRKEPGLRERVTELWRSLQANP